MKTSVAIALGSLALLSACSAGVRPGSAPASAPPGEVAQTAPVDTQPDQCGAKDLAYLVGRPRSDIPVPVDPSLRRVTCTTCAVTMDYRPNRLNIVFDAKTGVIKQVKCG